MIRSSDDLNLPLPECDMGYTRSQVEALLGDAIAEFDLWMTGQTGSICNGQEYDHHLQKYVPSKCGAAHGIIFYENDVRRFLLKLPVID